MANDADERTSRNEPQPDDQQREEPTDPVGTSGRAFTPVGQGRLRRRHRGQPRPTPTSGQEATSTPTPPTPLRDASGDAGWSGVPVAKPPAEREPLYREEGVRDAGVDHRSQRPPLPLQGGRRPRRDETAPERVQPDRSPHQPHQPHPPATPQLGRVDPPRRRSPGTEGERGRDGRRQGDRGRQSPISPGTPGAPGAPGGLPEGQGSARTPRPLGGQDRGRNDGRPPTNARPPRSDGNRGRPDERARPPLGSTPLQAAAPGPRGRLRVVPLGGVGEVGKNMTLVEYERDMILLDCGGKFPEEEQRGIDLIIPDVRYVRDRLANLRAIIITHGHEDHIGGLPYILPQFKDRAPIPIYGSPLALGFIETKLNEGRLDALVDLRPVQPGDRVQLGQLAVEFIHVTHSIPDTNAIAVHSPVGTIIDTADFKFDPTPVMGGPTDEALLRRLGDDGVLALFSDTVRVENAGSTPSERVVLETMDEVIRESKGQVIVTTFASNISRIHMALLAAHKYGRKVAVAGRSMEQNARVALDLGYLDPPEGLLLPLDEVLRLPKQKRVLVITGSQGEAAAALARIAAAEHPKIRVGAGDVVLVSATPVPGNEETVTRTIDNLFRRGTRVIYSSLNRGVHVSGHAGRDELRKMIDLLRPRYTVPIHGEFRHMVLYRELCAEAGIPADRVLLPEIGGVLEFTADSAVHKGKIPAGSILVDRLGDRASGIVTLRDREHLADDGVIVVTMVVDREAGKLIAGPDLVAKGLKPELMNGALKEAEADLKRMLERRSKGEPQLGYLVQRAKETVGKSLYRRSKSRPMILPVVTEL